jgi:hypothetical protein
MKKYSADDFWFELTEGPSPDGIGFVRYNEVTCRKCGAKAKHLASGQSEDQLRKFFIRQNWEIGRTARHHVCPACAHKHNHSQTRAQTLRTELPPSNVIPLRPRVTLQQAWDKADKEERAEFLLALEASHGVILARPQARPTPGPNPPETTLYRIVEPGLTHFDYNEIITTSELLDAQNKYDSMSFKVKAVQLNPPAPPQSPSRKDIDDFLREVKEHAKQPHDPPADDSWQHGTHIDSMPVEAPQPPIEHPVALAAEDDDDLEVADWWKELSQQH